MTTAVTTTTPAETTAVTTLPRLVDGEDVNIYIEMENILQLPELPTGCEITALAILLNFYGFPADKVDLADNHLPTSWGNPRYEDGKVFKDSFFEYFIGDPKSIGYGCFAPAITKAAESYLGTQETDFTVKNISGCDPDLLYSHLLIGTPVLCWATDGMIEPELHETWFDNETGEQLDWYYHEHAFVLVGLDTKNNTVTVNDPMKGIINYNKDKFELRFRQMYSQAIILTENA
jgi:uncharacterized protein YvpB